MTEAVVFPFGKNKGEPIKDAERGYLKWWVSENGPYPQDEKDEKWGEGNKKINVEVMRVWNNEEPREEAQGFTDDMDEMPF